jgi:hypothetical protein
MDAKKREETIQPQINADVRRYKAREISEAYSSKSYLRRSAFICGCLFGQFAACRAVGFAKADPFAVNQVFLRKHRRPKASRHRKGRRFDRESVLAAAR